MKDNKMDDKKLENKILVDGNTPGGSASGNIGYGTGGSGYASGNGGYASGNGGDIGGLGGVSYKDLSVGYDVSGIGKLPKECEHDYEDRKLQDTPIGKMFISKCKKCGGIK